MAQGIVEQALANLLNGPPEQHVAGLERFEAFVLGQRHSASEVRSQQTEESIYEAHDELLREQGRSEALNKAIEALSARPSAQRPIRMYPPKFDE